MNKEQVIELRKIHEGYNMSVFRTEGVVHHENLDKAHLIWDDDKEICHSINTNINSFSQMDKPATVDSFCYDAITGIFSNRSVEDLKMFLDGLKNKGLINDMTYNNIIEDYNPLYKYEGNKK